MVGGQTGDLLVNDDQQLGPGSELVRGQGRAVRFGAGPEGFQGVAAYRVGPGPRGHAIGNAVKPGAKPAMVAKPARLANQDQESRLKCIAGVMRVGKPAPADAHNHRTVALDQRFQGRFVAAGDEMLQQLAFVEPRNRPVPEQVVDPAEVGLLTRHATNPRKERFNPMNPLIHFCTDACGPHGKSVKSSGNDRAGSKPFFPATFRPLLRP